MSSKDLIYFLQLKSKIVATFNKTYPVNTDISQWKGQDISNFQEDLMTKTQGRISEKWFYTHLKNEHDKLPRIDMLNLLSQYCGYENWTGFKASVSIDQHSEQPNLVKSSYRRWILAGLVSMAILTYGIWSMSETITYQFCFTDADLNQPIAHNIEIIELRSNESPVHHQTDSSACFNIEPNNERLTFVIKSAYYKSDTITRLIKASGRETIQLKTNDYALMIHIFSNAKIEDWKKRRQQLKTMIADNARIYQIDNQAQVSIEWYNKREFIDKLTMPINSLKNIEVLETIYQNDQIVEMRFRQAHTK